MLNSTPKTTDETETDDLSDRNPGVERLLSRFERVYERLGNQREFLKRLCECLYQSVDPNLKKLLKATRKEREKQLGWPEWVDCHYALAQNKSLAVVGDLLDIGDGSNVRRNPQIHAVLTTNADNLLELYCQAKTRGHRLERVPNRQNRLDGFSRGGES